MKRFLFITSLIGITTVIIISSYFIFFRNDNYCKQFSGSAGYFEGETLAKECENAGCKVINKKEFSSMSEVKTCDDNTGECSKINIPLPDSGGYSFDCVPVKKVDKILPVQPVLKTKLQQCPDEWIDNRMPSTDRKESDTQYFILNGVRRELSEFDTEWIQKNCGLKKQEAF